MRPVPWRYVESWRCYGCGEICCKDPVVPLTTGEWIRLVQTFGVNIAEPRLPGLYLKKTPNNRCIFQYQHWDKYLCAIQGMKPIACRLWPFKISRRPLHGEADKALFLYREEKFYVYIDALCEGIKWGQPSKHLVDKVIPEFIEVSLGSRAGQIYSTSNYTLLSIPIKPKTIQLNYI